MTERRSNTSGRITALLRNLVGPVLLVLASVAFVAANAPAHQQMSLFDEYVYIDYLDKVDEQGIVRHGEMTGDLAREYYSCVGVDPFGTIAPENCETGEYDIDEQYPFGGVNSADIYTPLYFYVTWAAAQPIMWTTGGDLVESGRLAGFVWLAPAAVILYYSLGRLGLSPVTRVSGSLLLIASVAAWWSTTYISTDASALLVGASLLLFSLRFVQRGTGAWPLIIVSVLAVALKLQNLMSVMATVFFLLIMWWGQQRTRRRELLSAAHSEPPQLSTRSVLVTAIGMIVLPMVMQFGWLLVRAAMSLGEGGDQQIAQPLGVPELIREAAKLYGRVGLGGTIPTDEPIGWALGTVVTWIVTAGVVAAIATEPRWSERYSLALGWFAAAITAGPALAIATRLTSGFYFDLPLRYGMSLFPVALGLALCLTDRKTETQVATAALAGVTFVASLTPYFPGDLV